MAKAADVAAKGGDAARAAAAGTKGVDAAVVVGTTITILVDDIVAGAITAGVTMAAAITTADIGGGDVMTPGTADASGGDAPESGGRPGPYGRSAAP